MKEVFVRFWGIPLGSLRLKLLLVVLAITLLGLGAVMFSSLRIVNDANRDQAEVVNRQVSELVSVSVRNQLGEYRRRLEIIFKSWHANPELKIEPELFPDFIWLTIIDVTEKTVLQWAHTGMLAENSITQEELLGFKKKEELAGEVRAKFADKDRWMIFNSSIKATLPTFLLGTTFTLGEESERRFVALAEVKADRLFATLHPRRGQDLLLVDSHQNLLLSTKSGWDPSNIILDDNNLTKRISGLNDGEVDFAFLTAKKTKEKIFTSIFKLREGGGLTLILQEPVSQLEQMETNIQWRSITIMIVVLVIMLNLMFLFASSIISPLSELAQLMERVAKGDFSGKVKIKSKDEIGRLAKVFNKMITDLKERDTEIDRAKSRLIQSEKMSAFGQMSAGIAHEVKNPLAGILGYAQMSKKKLPPDSEVVPYMDIIEKETVRCKEIVENLMRFARQEKAVMQMIDINKTIKDSIRLVEHQMSISGIKIVQVYAKDGSPIMITGNSNQVQQVMMNLMLNAQQAMENKGTLTITTHHEPEQNRIIILISDTGAGMSEEVKQRIFEPFFTTKGVGKGTGLGLSVSIGIIKDHGGVIEVESEVGKGTTFQITLPTGTQHTSSSAAA